MTIMVKSINYTPFGRKFYELQDYTKFYGKFLEFCGLGGNFEDFKNSAHFSINLFNFFEQPNTSFKRSWREEKNSGVIFSF